MAQSEAHIRATRRYEEKAYWSPTLHLPKDFKERIQASGQSTNSFIREAIELKFEMMDKK